MLQNLSGRTVDQNIGETTTAGTRVAVRMQNGARGFSASMAYTYIKAIVAQPYFTCVTAPCNPLTNPAASAAAQLLPGRCRKFPTGRGAKFPVCRASAGIMRRWDFRSTLETIARAKIYADDRNTDAAAGYWVANLRAGFEQETRHWRFSEFARLDNLTNRAYVGSVIVNETQFEVFRARSRPNGLCDV